MKLGRLAPVLLFACHAPNHAGFTSVDFGESEATRGSSTSISPSEDSTAGGSSSGASVSGGSTAGESTAATSDSTDATTQAETGPSVETAEQPDPPQIVAFTVTPQQVEEAQSVSLMVEASPGVVEVELYYHGASEPFATVTPDQFPVLFDITSQAVCPKQATFEAVARDGQGDTATAQQAIDCELPASGGVVYSHAKHEGIGQAIVGLPGGGVMVGGILDDQIALWLFDDAGELLGEPKRIQDLSNLPEAMLSPSRPKGLAIDAKGVALAGEVLEDGVPRRLTMRLKHDGARVWEELGPKGEEVAGASIATNGTIFFHGQIRTGFNQGVPTYDAAGWGYPQDGGEPWMVQLEAPDDPDPDPDNHRSESGRASVYLPSDVFVILGDREYFKNNAAYTRSFVQAVTSSGEAIGAMWTSDGSDYAHNAILAATPTEEGFIGVGYAHHSGQVDQVYLQRFDHNLERVWAYTSPSSSAARGLALATDREHKLILAGYKVTGNQVDGLLQAQRGPGLTPAWTIFLDDMGSGDTLTAVTCDSWGYCTAAGMRAIADTNRLLLTRRYP